MKLFLLIPVILFAAPSFAAKIKDAKCSDVATGETNITPAYLAVIEGYNKSGKKVAEEIDFGGIVNESKNVSEKCSKDKSAKIESLRQSAKTEVTGSTPATAKLNPVKAQCKDFIALGEDVQPLAVFWVAGHEKSGKIKTGEIDEALLARPVATLVEECKAQPTASFHAKAKAWLEKHL